jgi:hypothetical protein
MLAAVGRVVVAELYGLFEKHADHSKIFLFNTYPRTENGPLTYVGENGAAAA